MWAHNWVTGIMEIGNVVQQLPPLMTTCTTIQQDVTTLSQWAAIFLTGQANLEATIKYNVKHNLLKMTRNLNKAKTAWADETYFAFGTTLGTMLVMATQPIPAAEELAWI